MTETCAYPVRGRDCKLRATTVVPGVDRLFCRQHARIVATEPGAAGIVRHAPQGLTAIIADLDAATTRADVRRCETAIAFQISECAPELHAGTPLTTALRAARARIKNGVTT